jgi:hypothetical protein
MNYFMLLIKSPAFWSALIGVISAIVMQYTGVPEAVWIPITALLGAVAAIFTGAEMSEGIGKSIAITFNRLEQEKLEKEKKEKKTK